jgi:hypothetical protein
MLRLRSYDACTADLIRDRDKIVLQVDDLWIWVPGCEVYPVAELLTDRRILSCPATDSRRSRCVAGLRLTVQT